MYQILNKTPSKAYTMAQCHQSHTIENILIKDKHWHKNSEYISMKKKNFYDHLMIKKKPSYVKSPNTTTTYLNYV